MPDPGVLTDSQNLPAESSFSDQEQEAEESDQEETDQEPDNESEVTFYDKSFNESRDDQELESDHELEAEQNMEEEQDSDQEPDFDGSGHDESLTVHFPTAC